MKVAMVQSGTEQGVGLLVDDKVISFTRAYPAYALASGSDEPIDPYFSILEMLQDNFFSAGVMEDVLRFLGDHQLLESFTIENPTLLAPIARPPKIVALGRNYVAHIEELGHEIPSEPVLFAKAPTSVIGPNEAIIYFDGLDRVDHEIELALVIGKTASKVSRDDAMEVIAGYTIFNDVTARNMQKVDIENRNPWFRSKSLDTFGPLGPWVVTPDELGNPHHLNLTCRVNGEIRQQSNTQNMMFRIPELIEYITRMITLEPGDIVVTGTPEGISAMYPGDVVECEIENIGVLSNPIVAENTPAP